MRAGKLRHPIELQAPTLSQSDTGEALYDWQDKGPAWAEIKTSGKVFFAAQQEHAELTHLLIIRYRPDIKPDWRVKLHDGSLLTVIVPTCADERGRQTELRCKRFA